MEPLAIGAALVAIATAGVKTIGWVAKKVRDRRAIARGPAAALSGPYPVRFTCREHTEFHPSSGYREGLAFEVFNVTDQSVTVKGFGLEISMSHDQGTWHEDEHARRRPPLAFPIRLDAHDGVEGYIDTEEVSETLHDRGEGDFVVGWRLYVDLIGYGRSFAPIEKATTTGS
jgi:hypothetical protein